MSKLLVQNFLETHSLGDLQREHGIYASASSNRRKISLNYDMIETKEDDKLSYDCRGLILSKKDFEEFTIINGKLDLDSIIGMTQVVAFGLKRFFNYGQGSAAQINWNDPNLAILEKLDGTLCIVYWDPFILSWCVATRSVPEADLLMDNGIFTFRTLFEKALFDTCGESFDEFTSGLNNNITYCFELTTPYNRVVCNYPDNRITFLAARSLNNLSEIDFHSFSSKKWVKKELFNKFIEDQKILEELESNNAKEAFLDIPFDLLGVPVVKSYAYTSVGALVDWVSTLNPLEHEGVVIRDSNFNRIKIKNAAYVVYNKLHDRLGTSERNCLELILLEKEDDAIPFLPEEIVNNLQKIKFGLQNAIQFHDETYAFVKGAADIALANDKKTFAIMIQKTIKLAEEKNKSLWQAPFFQIFDGKASNMKDFILKNKKDGTWSNSFLDKLLEISK